MNLSRASIIVANGALMRLKAPYDPAALDAMARYGVNRKNAYGISVLRLHELASEIGQDHVLAQELWNSGVHEAGILAGMVDDPKQVTEE